MVMSRLLLFWQPPRMKLLAFGRAFATPSPQSQPLEAARKEYEDKLWVARNTTQEADELRWVIERMMKSAQSNRASLQKLQEATREREKKWRAG